MNILKTLGIRLLSDFLTDKAASRSKQALYQSYGALLLPLLPTIFQYWALQQRKTKNTLRGITFSALALQGWICVTFAPKGFFANLILKGGSLFVSYRVFKLGVLNPLSSKKKISFMEYYRLVFTLSAKRPRNKRGFLWYFVKIFVQYLLANLIHLYFRYQPPQTGLTIRSLLSLKQPELAVQQYLYLLLLCLYISIYHFILVYPWCLLTGSQYSALFDFPLFPLKPKDLWSVRWNKRFHQNIRRHILGFINKTTNIKRDTSKGKSNVCLLLGTLSFFVLFVLPKILAMSESKSLSTLENPILTHGATIGVQMGLEQILGKNVLPERVNNLISNTFLAWSAPLLVAPLNSVVDMCAPPMLF